MSDLWQPLRRDGFVILRGIVPSDELDPLRADFERLVERQREIWRRERQEGDPPGGAWETSAQPRLVGYDGLVQQPAEAAPVELLYGRPLEVSQEIMGATAAPTQFMMMCNPVRDHGPAAWHRDIHPIDQAPVTGLQQDLLANRPGYLQWNLALHDDDVLWVVPGSHARPNTAEENRLLAEDPRRPLPEGVQVHLAAGDAVVYTNLILHWGSNYSARRRRTVHFGHRSLDGDLLPYVLGMHRKGDVSPQLSPATRRLWEEHRRLYEDECERIEVAFRAAVAGDAEGFDSAVAALHPGEAHREVALILLSKLARSLRFPEGHPERPGYGGDFTQQAELAPRFDEVERERLWERFAPLDEALKSPDGEEFVPGYQSGRMSYRFESMPDDVTLKEFVAGW
jgi:hypothetical protein